MKKIILPGIVAGAVMLAVGLLTGQIFNLLVPSLNEEYKNAELFRPWTDPLMSLYFVHPFVLGIILAGIWALVKPLFSGSPLSAGLLFGLVYALTGIPGMLMSYSSFTLSGAMIFSWLMSGILEAMCGGIVLAYMNRPKQTNSSSQPQSAA